MTAPRRHRVLLTNARLALLRAGFVQHIWPAQGGQPRQWVLTYTHRNNRITVALGPDPAVIPATWDGQHWRARHEDPPRDNIAAARRALSLLHRIHRNRQAAA